MNSSQALASLRRLPRFFTTNEVATELDLSTGAASARLAGLTRAGLAIRVRHGLWSLEPDGAPGLAAPYLTDPYPAYVSTFSALSARGLIEQIPRATHVVSTARSSRIETTLGPFLIHRIAPELFGGFEVTERGENLASAEKALFDVVYLRAARLANAGLPELELDADFDPGRVNAWTARIESGRLRTIVGRRLGEILRAHGVRGRGG